MSGPQLDFSCLDRFAKPYRKIDEDELEAVGGAGGERVELPGRTRRLSVPERGLSASIG
jgi:hypothetical protein